MTIKTHFLSKCQLVRCCTNTAMCQFVCYCADTAMCQLASYCADKVKWSMPKGLAMKSYLAPSWECSYIIFICRWYHHPCVRGGGGVPCEASKFPSILRQWPQYHVAANMWTWLQPPLSVNTVFFIWCILSHTYSSNYYVYLF